MLKTLFTWIVDTTNVESVFKTSIKTGVVNVFSTLGTATADLEIKCIFLIFILFIMKLAYKFKNKPGHFLQKYLFYA